MTIDRVLRHLRAVAHTLLLSSELKHSQLGQELAIDLCLSVALKLMRFLGCSTAEQVN